MNETLNHYYSVYTTSSIFLFLKCFVVTANFLNPERTLDPFTVPIGGKRDCSRKSVGLGKWVNETVALGRGEAGSGERRSETFLSCKLKVFSSFVSREKFEPSNRRIYHSLTRSVCSYILNSEFRSLFILHAPIGR